MSGVCSLLEVIFDFAWGQGSSLSSLYGSGAYLYCWFIFWPVSFCNTSYQPQSCIRFFPPNLRYDGSGRRVSALLSLSFSANCAMHLPLWCLLYRSVSTEYGCRWTTAVWPTLSPFFFLLLTLSQEVSSSFLNFLDWGKEIGMLVALIFRRELLSSSPTENHSEGMTPGTQLVRWKHHQRFSSPLLPM